MGELEDFRLFLKIVEAGSVSGAALEMGLAKSAVSRRLANLEARFGLSLIDRRPGVWALTERGHQLYQRAGQVVEEVGALKAELANERLALVGPLSISLPRDIGLASLARVLPEFSAAYPHILLNLQFDNRFVDLRHESFDAALRIVATPPEGVAAQHLITYEAKLVASPAYLASALELKGPEDLAAHRFLTYGNALTTDLSLGGQRLRVRGASCSNSGLYLRDAAVAGQGIAALPSFLCEQELAEGSLTCVLEDWPLPSLSAYLCTPLEALPNRRVQVFAAFLKQLMTPCP